MNNDLLYTNRFYSKEDLNETKIGYEVYDNGRNTNQENDE